MTRPRMCSKRRPRPRGVTSLFWSGLVALVVGGIGIANVMVMGVIERRGETGLRAHRLRPAATPLLLTESLRSAPSAGWSASHSAPRSRRRTQCEGWRIIAVAVIAGLGAASIGAIAGLARHARLVPDRSARADWPRADTVSRSRRELEPERRAVRRPQRPLSLRRSQPEPGPSSAFGADRHRLAKRWQRCGGLGSNPGGSALTPREHTTLVTSTRGVFAALCATRCGAPAMVWQGGRARAPPRVVINGERQRSASFDDSDIGRLVPNDRAQVNLGPYQFRCLVEIARSWTSSKSHTLRPRCDRRNEYRWRPCKMSTRACRALARGGGSWAASATNCRRRVSLAIRMGAPPRSTRRSVAPLGWRPPLRHPRDR